MGYRYYFLGNPWEKEGFKEGHFAKREIIFDLTDEVSHPYGTLDEGERGMVGWMDGWMDR